MAALIGKPAGYLKTEYAMNQMAALRAAVDRVLLGDFEPLHALMTDDVAFSVAVGGDTKLCREDSGKPAVADYFRLLGGMVTFWQIDYTARGDQLIAWGRESFTVEPCGIDATSEFALVFEVSGGLISSLFVIEDLPAFFRASRSPGLVKPGVLDLIEHLAERELATA
jgi:hypothetical protein